MIRQSCASVLFLGILSASASAGPVLLASFDQKGGFSSASSTIRVGFVLGLYEQFSEDAVLIGTDPSATSWPFFQPLRFWGEGETGYVELTPTSDAGFAAFALAATDGTDNQFVTWESWDPWVRGGHGGSESILFGREGDLLGYSLELVRINVNNIRYVPQGFQGPEWQWEITYEFFGSQIVPEPRSVIGILFLGILVLRRWAI